MTLADLQLDHYGSDDSLSKMIHDKAILEQVRERIEQSIDEISARIARRKGEEFASKLQSGFVDFVEGRTIQILPPAMLSNFAQLAAEEFADEPETLTISRREYNRLNALSFANGRLLQQIHDLERRLAGRTEIPEIERRLAVATADDLRAQLAVARGIIQERDAKAKIDTKGSAE